MKKILLLIVPTFLIFSSCKKEVTKVQQVAQAYSAVYTIQPGDWTTNNNGLSYTAELNVPELDNIIYQNGAVLVYLSFSGTSYYEAIPEVFDGITYGSIHSTGYVSIDISAISGNLINPPSQTISAKVVLIDATALAMHKDVNLNDLGAVQKAFNIH
ncbi:MAG: hypothetical protein KGM16_01935 [Bacteroidota bacterium]|nr:hypothetical protein [Bacteroidota bacterium]